MHRPCPALQILMVILIVFIKATYQICSYVHSASCKRLSKLALQGHLVAFGRIIQSARPIIHHRKQMTTCTNC